MIAKDILAVAAKMADKTMRKNKGGPFGACIVKDGKIIAVASNSVLRDKNPTCHAEMNAIKKACKKLHTYDLSGCILYTTGYPCPMCLAAIIWANIGQVYYGTTLKQAAEIGFRDDFIYDFIRGKNKKVLSLKHVKTKECTDLFKTYTDLSKVIY